MRRARTWALATLGFAAAVGWSTWPLPRHLASHVIDAGERSTIGGAWGRADVDLLVWVLAWDAHALATAPTRLFDANIMYPAPNVLASSEHLIGLMPIATPIFLATRNAILTYNATLLATALVTALTMFALVRAWTESAPAAALAAVAFAFSPLNLSGWVRLHVSAVHLFPLVLLLAWRAAGAPRPATLAFLALATALQLLAGVYLAFELAICVAAFLPAFSWQARRHGHTGITVVAAMGVGALALVPVGIAYWRARAAGTLPTYGTGSVFALPLGGLLLQLGAALTWPVVALAVVGVFAFTVAPRHLRFGLVFVALVGVAFCLGPDAPLVPGTDIPGLYALAARSIPGFAGMRESIRFAVVPLLASAALAGVGAAALARRSFGRVLVTAAVPVLFFVRPPHPPIPLSPAPLDGPRMAVYHWLRDHGGGRPVLEVPGFVSALEAGRLRDTGRYMLGSTLHWAPLVNGYTGHPPPSFSLISTLADRLPRADAFEPLCSLLDLGWIVVHYGSLTPPELQAWQDVEQRLPLVRTWSEGQDVVYRVDGRCGALEDGLRRQLAHPDEGVGGHTLTGLSRAPLPAGARRAVVEGLLPDEVYTGLFASFRVRVRNSGTGPWPGLSAHPSGTVALQARWRNADTDAVVSEGRPSLLARDLAPGEAIEAAVSAVMPPPGQYVLEIGLVQVDVGSFPPGPHGEGVLRRRVTSRLWRRPAPGPPPASS